MIAVAPATDPGRRRQPRWARSIPPDANGLKGIRSDMTRPLGYWLHTDRTKLACCKRQGRRPQDKHLQRYADLHGVASAITDCCRRIQPGMAEHTRMRNLVGEPFWNAAPELSWSTTRSLWASMFQGRYCWRGTRHGPPISQVPAVAASATACQHWRRSSGRPSLSLGTICRTTPAADGEPERPRTDAAICSLLEDRRRRPRGIRFCS